MKKLILVMFLISFNLYAFPEKSGPFYFPGGAVPPKTDFPGILNISIQSLPRNVRLKITCDIENPHYNMPYPVVLEFLGSLNGVTSPSNLYLLNHEISKYERQLTIDGTQPQGNPSHIRFSNHDDSDAVYIKNCMAVYATG